uniref:Vacuolar protein-sorting-associated protein 25 n=1 Tax=Corethrella appendiculata TaxID=1370023 RepID=U5EN43_9DIPT
MSEFQWPWEYNFPPFFTIQLHGKTKVQQIATWKSLVLNYQKSQNQSILNINEETPLFYNEKLNRKLSLEGRTLILEELSKTGNSCAIDKQRKQQWEIYWHTLDEWSTIIYNWAQASGMTNTVCTLFELTSGDNTVGEEFYGLEQNILLKVLKILESKGKCELIVFDDNEGVKFF